MYKRKVLVNSYNRPFANSVALPKVLIGLNRNGAYPKDFLCHCLEFPLALIVVGHDLKDIPWYCMTFPLVLIVVRHNRQTKLGYLLKTRCSDIL